ncbi:hypothetical protein DPMN_090350 [Dreissena polymorpha]|uniref:Uncharacterized protein n=1 Tax=Dreissena polymorpha TaxID=45954 RepID=A0A9D4KYG9_DREPO|nr:hypothetical protein DPMN_090350 [Dreissena polymorpha]
MVFSDSLQASYTARLQEIQEMRIEINLALDKLQNATLKEMNEKMDTLNASITINVDKCSAIVKDIERLSTTVTNLKNTNDELSFIAYQKSLDIINDSESFLCENSSESELTFIFQPDLDIVQFLSKLPGFGSIVYDKPLLPTCDKQDNLLHDSYITFTSVMGSERTIFMRASNSCHVHSKRSS